MSAPAAAAAAAAAAAPGTSPGGAGSGPGPRGTPAPVWPGNLPGNPRGAAGESDGKLARMERTLNSGQQPSEAERKQQQRLVDQVEAARDDARRQMDSALDREEGFQHDGKSGPGLGAWAGSGLGSELATREPALAIDVGEGPTAAGAPRRRTDPLSTTTARVANFISERDTERDRVYDAVLAHAGYIIVAGLIPVALIFVLAGAGVVDSEMFYYMFSVGYVIAECGIMYMTMLPPGSFDFDNAMDNRPLARRAMTIGIILLNSAVAFASFPHVVMMAGALAFFVKLVWDERAVGCCKARTDHGARVRTFHHRPAPFARGVDRHRARRHSGWRPRLSDMVSVFFLGITTFQDGGLKSIIFVGPCHGAAAAAAGAPMSTSINNTSVGNTTTNLTLCTEAHRASASTRMPDAQQAVFWYISGAIRFGVSTIILLTHLTQRCRYHRGRGGWNATLALYNILYLFFILEGAWYLFWGAWRTHVLNAPDGPAVLLVGALSVVPYVAALVYGRQKLFQIMAQRFEQKRRGLDSALIAELMNDTVIECGVEWWVHHGNNLVDKYPDPVDHRANWTRARIVEVQRTKYAINLNVEQERLIFGNGSEDTSPGGGDSVGTGSMVGVRKLSTGRSSGSGAGARSLRSVMGGIRRMKTLAHTTSNKVAPAHVLATAEGTRSRASSGNTNSPAARHPNKWLPLPEWVFSTGPQNAMGLLNQAHDQLRALDGRYLTHGLMQSNAVHDDDDTKAAVAAIRKLRVNEKHIDYFLSHSWHDDATAKFAVIAEVKEAFKASNGGRECTFWLDKVCIDQTNIAEGLKILCINVTACNKLLVVCGRTYFQRLWCMLELFMLFAFADEENAVSRIELVPIEADGVTRESILESMANFKLNDAHCFDPNEEIKLRTVMAAVGEEKFVGRIRSLAGKIRRRDAMSPRVTRRRLRPKWESSDMGGGAILNRIF